MTRVVTAPPESALLRLRNSVPLPVATATLKVGSNPNCAVIELDRAHCSRAHTWHDSCRGPWSPIHRVVGRHLA
jgi:hypothetical protein